MSSSIAPTSMATHLASAADAAAAAAAAAAAPITTTASASTQALSPAASATTAVAVQALSLQQSDRLCKENHEQLTKITSTLATSMQQAHQNMISDISNQVLQNTNMSQLINELNQCLKTVTVFNNAFTTKRNKVAFEEKQKTQAAAKKEADEKTAVVTAILTYLKGLNPKAYASQEESVWEGHIRTLIHQENLPKFLNLNTLLSYIKSVLNNPLLRPLDTEFEYSRYIQLNCKAENFRALFEPEEQDHNFRWLCKPTATFADLTTILPQIQFINRFLAENRKQIGACLRIADFAAFEGLTKPRNNQGDLCMSLTIHFGTKKESHAKHHLHFPDEGKAFQDAIDKLKEAFSIYNSK